MFDLSVWFDWRRTGKEGEGECEGGQYEWLAVARMQAGKLLRKPWASRARLVDLETEEEVWSRDADAVRRKE